MNCCAGVGVGAAGAAGAPLVMPDNPLAGDEAPDVGADTLPIFGIALLAPDKLPADPPAALGADGLIGGTAAMDGSETDGVASAPLASPNISGLTGPLDGSVVPFPPTEFDCWSALVELAESCDSGAVVALLVDV